ncbi:EamA family transporter RarD [Luteolibacter sp. GHJ8]|uniref:EamA family transporter RarD n=1 Tax=Luteolibacter rhizosphaerae TaxID=2989719 RepID=A0ABT3G1G5_9BACT|nr:EamA family transporter RarD [Luteolibacter rhizosphaerae]MCW1913668.1 EamA family transporter RarD [Luteolibacter rhizosphaerae]
MDRKDGVLSAIAAFILWGVLPIFWKAMVFLPPASIIAHRTIWSLVALLPVLAYQRQVGTVIRGISSWRGVGWHLLSGCLLASNWLLYVWATLNDRILEGALGYYLNPFLNMLFGALFFGERQTRLQMIAVAVAAVGVGFQFEAVQGVPWVALVLATTFALYAVVRKKAPLAALPGLAAETALLAPVALLWLIWQGSQGAALFGGSTGTVLLVLSTGIATATPLLCFGHAARTISLTTLGILQFIGPTLQFLIGWQLYGEPMNPMRMLSFGLIWAAVAIYAGEAIYRSKKKAAPDGAAS